jgi:coniferyl-aldehyde dehydrogenase
MESSALTLAQCLERQRAAYRADPYPDLEQRTSHLAALYRFLEENEAAIIEAIEADFGVRPATETRLIELFPVRQGIRDTKRHLAKWMRSRRRSVDQLIFPGASNRVVPQPLGVVGVMVPWNFPVFLSFGPLVDILAAGNHAMVKMSDRSANLARLLIDVFPRYLPPEKVAFFEDLGRGPEFSQLPFDHMIFTGSGAVGRAVMASAAANLCPVTLELGGKAPAVVAPDFPLETAAERVLWAKCMNAGQVCVNIDYLFVPEGSADAFVAHAQRLVAERFPDLNGRDYTTIIDQPAYDRLVATLEDASSRGATVINLAPDQQLDARRRKFAPHIVLGVTDDMTIMKEEIFGPLLPVKTYRDADEVIAYVNAHDRPLAARPAVRRGRRERHGAIPRLRRLPDLLEAPADLPSGPLFVDPNGAAATLRTTRKVRLVLDVQAAWLVPRLAPGTAACSQSDLVALSTNLWISSRGVG